jgi:hypothetical protein
MSNNVGTIEYDVSMDTSKMLTAQRDIDRKLDTMGNAGDKLQARFTAIAAGISAALSAIAIEGFVSKVVTAQRQFDVLFSSLKTVTGGANQASVAWERLVGFAAKTPYSLAQSVEGFTKLKALGLDPSERAMTSFGNTASAMGKDLMQMIEAVADASTGEFERLKEFGIKAKQNGDEVSLTFKGVTTTIKNSSEQITEYLTKIGETDFAGAMEDRSKTLDGSISNLEDRFAGLYLTISQSGIGDAVKSAVDKASEVLGELANSVKDGRLTDYFATLKALMPAVELTVVSLAGALTARLIGAMVATVAQAYATATAIGVASVATTTFTGIISALGGPVGIAITALILLVSNWDKLGFSAKNAADISEDAARRIAGAQAKTQTGAAKDYADQVKEYGAAIKKLQEARAREKVASTGPASVDTIRGIDEKISAYQQAIEKIKKLQDPAGGGRGMVNPDPVREASPTPPGKPDKKTKTKAEKAPFDAEGYLSELRKAQASEINVINETETQKLRDAKKHLDERKLNEKDYATAVTLIVQTAEQDRLALMQKTQAEIDRMREQEDAKTKQAEQKRDQGRQVAQEAIASVNPIDAVRQEEAEKLAVMDAARQLDMQSAQLYEDAKVAIKQTAAEKIKQIEADQQQKALQSQSMILGGAQNLFGSMADITKTFAGEQSGIYKAMFSVSKAFAIADSIIKIQQGIASAASLPFPANLGAMATVAASTAGIISTISSASFGGGRQYGGPVSSGSLYRVNETGAPEMYTGSSGKQYLLPTAGGRVTAANKVGGTNWTFIVQNNASTASVSQPTVDDQARTVTWAVSEVANQIRSNSGQVWSAMRSATNVQSRL